MSRRANPTKIGLFMIGAIILTVIGVATLTSAEWFEKRSTFISYFSESVNGLERGAPVKFQGVPVGSVTELLIQIDESDKTFQVPVQYEIDLTRLTSPEGTFVHLNEASVLRQQIADGLRAQLQMVSMVTNQLYIELSYRPDADQPELARGPTPHPEIPTTPSLLAAFGTEAGSVVADVLQVLFRVNEMLEEVDVRGINTAVVASAQAVQRLADSRELKAAIDEFTPMTTQVSTAMAEMQVLAEALTATIGPLQAQMEGTNAEAALTLQSMREAIEDAHALLATDSGIGYQLEQALASLRSAAEALRVLAISLERNPDMLLRGKKSGGG